MIPTDKDGKLNIPSIARRFEYLVKCIGTDYAGGIKKVEDYTQTIINEALEEAAKVADFYDTAPHKQTTGDAIRALKEKANELQSKPS